MITLNKLLHNIIDSRLTLPELEITGLSLDSRQIVPGDLFFAYKGTALDGRTFIPQAIQKGAVSVLQEGEAVELSYNIPIASGFPTRFRGVSRRSVYQIWEDGERRWQQSRKWGSEEYKSIPIITAPNVIKLVSKIASQFYQEPSNAIQVIGITGTSGKTSCSHLLAQSFRLLGDLVGFIGSNGYGVGGEIIKKEATTTTPDPIKVQSILNEFRGQKVDKVTMEVTSHALEQGRVSGVKIDVGIFTNLSRDHLDYHKTMQNYAAAKHKLFEMAEMRYGIFNLDDSFGVEWAREFHSKYNTCGFTLDLRKKRIFKNLPFVGVDQLTLSKNGIEMYLQSSWGSGLVQSRLLGRFNASNLLAVIATLLILNYDFQKILTIVPQLDPIHGRVQTFGGEGGKPLVVIDYAHKPDALEKVLEMLKESCEGQLVCVFGCGGDRDKGKRPMMGKIAERLADKVILTNDNIRSENQEEIVCDILAGITSKENVKIEYDRRKAIEKAIREAGRSDIVLIAGKGHEDYQIIGTKKFHFYEPEIIQEILKDAVMAV